MPKALSVREIEGKPGQVYYPLQLSDYKTPAPKENEVVVKMHAAALNHRDLFIRQKLYPAVGFGIPLCADGTGVVTATGSSPAAKEWQGKRVIMNPGTGWKDDPFGPEEGNYKILGGTKLNPRGTAVEEFISDIEELEEAPSHMTTHEAAALPLAGLTAWRATAVKAKEAMMPGKNILITGIGGGVALMALAFAVAAGANVYVSSGSEEKINRAKQMGAKGGINYKEKAWEKALKEMLPKENKQLDAIIDGAGGDIIDKGQRLLKPGGTISVYGMTTGPKMPFLMSAVLKNIEVRGSTMGSRKEFADMVAFCSEKKVRPIVSRVAKGLDNQQELESLFEEMKKGSQFGKLVIEISKDASSGKL